MERLRYRQLKGHQGDWLVDVEWEDGTMELVPDRAQALL